MIFFPKIRIIILALCLATLLIRCGTQDESPPVVIEKAEPASTLWDDLNDEERYAGLPDDFVQLLKVAVEEGREEEGNELYLTQACAGCHMLTPEEVVAPTFYNIGNKAVSRQPDVSPAEYLYTSIVDTDAFVPKGYLAGVMPADYGEKLNNKQLIDLVAYLISQRAE